MPIILLGIICFKLFYYTRSKNSTSFREILKIYFYPSLFDPSLRYKEKKDASKNQDTSFLLN